MRSGSVCFKVLSAVSLCSLVNAVTTDDDDDDNNYSRAGEVDLRNSTTLIGLDSFVYDVIVDPTKGSGEELLSKLELLTHCMRKARTMFTYGNEENDYAIRAATLIFFNSGGPTFSRIPLYDEANILPLKRQYNWTDEDIKKLEEKQAEAERAWNKLRRSIL
uniref:Uncharacterized protein n=1 Tax=Cuerna arida TaxID=1464854 RepID=A0A1B6FDS7_9HEMI